MTEVSSADGYSILHNDSFNSYPAVKVTPVDTTGAGDSFVGGFVHSLASGLEPISAAEFAGKVAAKSVMQKGTQKSYPSAKDF